MRRRCVMLYIYKSYIAVGFCVIDRVFFFKTSEITIDGACVPFSNELFHFRAVIRMSILYARVFIFKFQKIVGFIYNLSQIEQI